MKKILIFYASFGGGNLNAAKALKEYIDENYIGYTAQLIDCLNYANKPIEKIYKSTYRTIAKKAPWVWGGLYKDSNRGITAHISSRTNTILAIKLLNLIRDEEPEMIISTHPFSTQMCNYLKRKGKIDTKIATVITNFSLHYQWLIDNEYTDYFFVANDEIKDALLSEEIPRTKIFVTGIPISLKFWETYNKLEILNNYDLKDNLKTILFFGGGEYGLGRSKTIEVFRTLVENFDDLQIIAISGKNPKLKRTFEDIVKNNDKEDFVKVLEYSDQIPKLMAISNLVISKPGGLTTSECLASGLPMVMISPIPGQEEENAEFLENNGAGIWIRKKDSSYNSLYDILSNPDKLEGMKENIRPLSKKYAAESICRTIFRDIN